MSLASQSDAERYRALIRLRWAGLIESDEQDELDALTERLRRVARAWREVGGAPGPGVGDAWLTVEA